MRSLSLPRKYRAKTFAILLACAAPFVGPVSPGFAQPASASAAGVDDDLAEAEKLIANVDYEGAISVLERVSKRSGLSHEQLIRTYRNLATAHAVVGHAAVSRDIFVKLIAIDPDFKIDQNMSPRVKAPYFEARGQWSAQSIKPGIEATANVRRNTDSRVVVTLRDPTRLVSRINVAYHWEGDDPFIVKSSAATPTTTVVVPPPKGKSSYLEIYAQGVDANDNVLFENGSQTKPIVIEAPAQTFVGPGGEPGADRSSSIFASPVFWVIAGAVILGGATAAYFATRPPDPASGGQLTPVLFCGERACP